MKEKFYYEAFDIDWFLLSKDRSITHFASGGGTVPEIVIENLEEVKVLNNYFRSQPIISAIIVNPFLKAILKNTRFGNSGIEGYLKDFKWMAERGIRSFDNTMIEDPANPTYNLVTRPGQFLNFDSLPNEIKEILLKFETDLDFNSIVQINLNDTQSYINWYKY